MRRDFRLTFLTALALACAGLTARGWAVECRIADDRTAVIDGARTFVLGLYESNLDDAQLKRVAGAGFNLVRAPENTEALDRLHAHGLWAWLNTGMRIDLSSDTENHRAQLQSMAESFSDHPALLVWEVPDEALWNVWYRTQQWKGRERNQLNDRSKALEDAALAAKLRATLDKAGEHYARGEYALWEQGINEVWKVLGESPPNPELLITNAPERATRLANGMLEGYRLLREIDPKHPVWMNHAPRNSASQLAEFNRAADIVGCDIYPVPEYKMGHSDLLDNSMTSVGAFTRLMQAPSPDKPVWMVLQGFGWADIQEGLSEEQIEERRRPTLKESRFMAYDAIVNGARGILYWGTAYIEKDSECWDDLLTLVRELADLQPVLSAPEADLHLKVTYAETWGSRDTGIRMLARDVGGSVHFIVVNEWRHYALPYTIHGLESLEGTTFVDETADRRATVKDGKLSLAIRRHGIQVLSPVK